MTVSGFRRRRQGVQNCTPSGTMMLASFVAPLWARVSAWAFQAGTPLGPAGYGGKSVWGASGPEAAEELLWYVSEGT